MSLEHVIPQSMTEEWYEVLRKQTDPDETESELHGRLLHTLGNLTLTAQNSKPSNHMFERKQKIFQSSGLSMNRQIADAPSWEAGNRGPGGPSRGPRLRSVTGPGHFRGSGSGEDRARPRPATRTRSGDVGHRPLDHAPGTGRTGGGEDRDGVSAPVRGHRRRAQGTDLQGHQSRRGRGSGP